MPTRVRSFAKINLGLAVGPARPDGFHALTTVYQTLALHDFVTVTARPAPQTTITLTANHPGVPRTETADAHKNTAYVIVEKALQRLGLTAEVHIDIDKRLPVQGGMGAGSANAVAALLGLEREQNKSLSGPDRLALAAEVGSDVPLFLLGGTVLGLGRGEEVYPLPDLPATPAVAAIPTVGVSTKLAFEALDKDPSRQPSPTPCSLLPNPSSTPNPSSSLTFPHTPDTLKKLSRVLTAVWTPDGTGTGPSGITLQQGDLAQNPLLALVRTGIENDFEEVAFSQHPSLRSIKRELVGSGSSQALYACLSGSGSALFGLYADHAHALQAQQRVLASGTEALLTETLPRTGYWDTMFAE